MSKRAGAVVRLLIIRHGIAEPGGKRPLSSKGVKRTRQAMRGVARLLPEPRVLASSPLPRARQTAELLSEAHGGLKVVVRPELLPDARPRALLPWLLEQREQELIALTGHEPHLGRLVAWLVVGKEQALVELKKGAACLLELQAEPGPGSATLSWLLQPKQLRAFGRS